MISRGTNYVDLLLYIVALKGHDGLPDSLNMHARRLGIS